MDRVTLGKKVRKKTAKEKSFLPDEIITTHILIRLPAKSAIRCRLVCRKWRDIISTRDFVDLHQRSSIPVILVAAFRDYTELDLYMLDKWWEFTRTRFLIHRFPFYPRDYSDASEALFSHAGLVVLNECPYLQRTFVILNPARPRHECVKIALCNELRKSDICAVYYHPSLKEYCSLLKIDKSKLSSRSEPIQYKLLNLGSNPSLRTIRNPFNYRVKDKDAYPLFINNHLYWLLESVMEDKFSGRNDILEFDIISEEFMVIHCPVPLNTECRNHQTHLLISNGILSFLLILPNTITVWRLEDHAQHLWTTNKYAISIEIGHCYESIRVIAFVNGMLAFRWRERLFVWNLKEGTMKNYPKGKYKGDISFLSHQMSLAPLKNCKSDLYIDKDGKVLV